MMEVMVRDLNDELPNTEPAVQLEEIIPPEDLERFRAELHESHKQALAGELIPIDEILDEL